MPRGDSLHFRMGKGLIRERRKAQSPKSIAATLDFLLGNDEQKKREVLERMKREMESPDQPTGDT